MQQPPDRPSHLPTCQLSTGVCDPACQSGEPPVDRAAPTPRASGSFAAFYEASRDLARVMREANWIKRKRVDAIDRRGAERCAQLAHDFDVLAKRFAAWPTSNPETVALERTPLTCELVDKNREAQNLLLSIPLPRPQLKPAVPSQPPPPED